MLYAVIEVQGQPRVTPQGPARPDRVQIQAPSGTPMQRNLSRFGFSHSLYSVDVMPIIFSVSHPK